MTLVEVLELNIFSLPGLHDLPFAEKEKLSAEMSRDILAAVAEDVAMKLPEEKREEFAEIFGAPHATEERALFLRESVPDFEEILVYQALEFKKDLKEYLETKNPDIAPQ